jgi:hypothetical protein
MTSDNELVGLKTIFRYLPEDTKRTYVRIVGVLPKTRTGHLPMQDRSVTASANLLDWNYPAFRGIS